MPEIIVIRMIMHSAIGHKKLLYRCVWPHHFTMRIVWAHTTSLSSSPLCVRRQPVKVVMNVYVRGIDFVSVSTIPSLDLKLFWQCVAFSFEQPIMRNMQEITCRGDKERQWKYLGKPESPIMGTVQKSTFYRWQRIPTIRRAQINAQ